MGYLQEPKRTKYTALRRETEAAKALSPFNGCATPGNDSVVWNEYNGDINGSKRFFE
jgi:hypothetical protein